MKIFLTSLVLLGIFCLYPQTASAVCPVCTVAVVGGLGLSRFLGIDDSVSGVWVGGLILSLSFWTTTWINKKGWLKKTNPNIVTGVSALLLSVLTFVPMYTTNFIGHPANQIWGIDKLTFGTVVGAFGFLIGYLADQKVRQLKGRQLFVYQKVVFPVTALIIASVILYLVTK